MVVLPSLSLRLGWLLALAIPMACAASAEMLETPDHTPYSRAAPEDACLGCLGAARGHRFEKQTSIDVPAEHEGMPYVRVYFTTLGSLTGRSDATAAACGLPPSTELALMITTLEPAPLRDHLEQRYGDELRDLHASGVRPLSTVIDRVYLVDRTDPRLGGLETAPLEIRGGALFRGGKPLPTDLTRCSVGYRVMTMEVDPDGRIGQVKERP